MTATDYDVEVRYSFANKGYLATVREFPRLYYVGHTPAAAREGLLMKLGSVLGGSSYHGFPVPRPMARTH